MAGDSSSTDYAMSYASQFLDTEEASALQQRLGLYQVFLKLYEHRRELLDEILNLETDSLAATVRSPYLQGMMLHEPQLITNLIDGKTQAILQPEFRWIIGRNPGQATIAIADRRLSRAHAVIEYASQQGFYLSDLNSRNGTFVNGEPIRQPTLLRDGDRVRLGSLSFIFFLCTSAQVAATDLPSEDCSPIAYSPFSITAAPDFYSPNLKIEQDDAPPNSPQEATFSFMR